MVITKYKYGGNIGKRIALLFDIHGRRNPEILKELKTSKVDLIAIVGDLFDGAELEVGGVSKQMELENGIAYLKKMLDIAPMYYSFGNHEWGLNEQDINIIRQTGLFLLNDKYIELVKNIYIDGFLSTTRYGKYKNTNTKLNQSFLNMFASLKGFKILLCHHLEYYDDFLKDKELDLILAGHAHGGQIWKFNRGLFAPG